MMKVQKGERKKPKKRIRVTEKELTRLNRTLQTLYQCNHALVHATDENELFQSVCETLVAVGGLRLAWVGQCEEDAQKTVRPVAVAGYGVEYVKSAKISWSEETERGRGPTGIALRTGKPYWVRDTQMDPSFAPWRAAAVERRYASCIALPLIAYGMRIGSLNLYAGKPNAFNESTIEQYSDLANNLAYGVVALRGQYERKRAEEALREAQATLAHVSRVTTMGELTASIAHELNQPLTGVVANGEACLRWLAGTPPNLEEARQSVMRIIRDGRRAADVIARIRALLRKAGTEMVPMNINDAIQEVVALIQAEVRKNRVKLRIDLDPNLPPVIGDRVQLQQVVLNLLINAIEAMMSVDGDHRKLRVISRCHEPATVLVAVRDSGLGIGQQSIEEMSQAFFTTKPHGMGMGLSISRSIIRSHGGRLWVEPNADCGATFQFTLPVGGVPGESSVEIGSRDMRVSGC
jgi:signal transduction histidine kinase